MTPQLSIVIPSHARADLLHLCLQSLEHHSPPDTEIIVVDDASTDGVISKAADAFPGVRCIRLSSKSGFCVAANTGLRAARGTFVELLNDDTQVTAGWAEAALKAFENPLIGAVAPLVLQGVPGDADPRIDSAGDSYHPGGFARKIHHNERLADVHPEAGFVFGASGSSCFYRREVLDAIGLLPEHFGAYFEDVDLAHRLNRAGHRTWFEPASVVHHRVGSSHGRKPDRKLLEQQSLNEERVFWRNQSMRHIPMHAAVLAGKAIKRVGEGNFVPFARGRMRAFGEMLKKAI